MERLKHIEETLLSCIESQLSHLECVDTHELGEAIDMIKDLAESKYYCSVVKAMEETEEYSRDIDRNHGRMYYEGRQNWGREPREVMVRDPKEGRSPVSRKTYMESKVLHKDKASKIKDLEKYMAELTTDIVEMIEDASPEERQMLEKKMTNLTTKISSLNA